jgi:hypothetical protein
MKNQKSGIPARRDDLIFAFCCRHSDLAVGPRRVEVADEITANHDRKGVSHEREDTKDREARMG